MIKCKLLNQYSARHILVLDNHRILQLGFVYHDINRCRDLFYLVQRCGQAARVCSDVEVFDSKISSHHRRHARKCRAATFIRAVQAKHHDFTVDSLHLKLND